MTDEVFDRWDAGYARWQKYHRTAFGWGEEKSKDLFMYWDALLFGMQATETELEEATDWIVGIPETFDDKWERHYSLVRRRITQQRAEAAKVAARKAEEAVPDPKERERVLRMPDLVTDLARRMAMPKE